MTASMETPRDMALNRSLPEVLIEPVVRMALAEDLGRAGDVTALACIPPGARMKAAFTARKAGVLAGIQAVRLAVQAMDPTADVELRLADGAAFETGAVLAVVEAERGGDPDAGLCSSRRRDQGADRRYPQDDAGPAGAGETCGGLRRRGEPPVRPG